MSLSCLLTLSVINVHGGGWVFGRAEDASSAEIEYYNNAGLVFVSLEYRFIPQYALASMYIQRTEIR